MHVSPAIANANVIGISRFVRRLHVRNLPFSQTVNQEIFRIFVLEISFVQPK
jgi:hypothetical protein